jgi:predicted GNAT family N-acyltransferase
MDRRSARRNRIGGKNRWYGEDDVTAESAKEQTTEQEDVHTWVVESLAEMGEVYAVREEVFVGEQGLTGNVRDDPDDRYSVHVLAAIGDTIVGTGRTFFIGDQGQIAWVAVRGPYRRQGVGWAIMQRLLDICREQGVRVVTLNAQTHALSFYEALGFEPVGRRFTMSNIEHQQMILDWTVPLP